MRKIILVLMISLLLLAGCSAGGKLQKDVDSFCEDLKNAASLSFEGKISANLGSEVFDFTVSYESGGGEAVVEITEPRLIAGVKAHVYEGGAGLEYEDVFISVGSITEDGTTPMEAIPTVMRAMKIGYVSGCYKEKSGDSELTAATFLVTDTLDVKVWFSPDTMTPVYAELIDSGSVAASVAISNFTMDRG